MKMNKEKLAFDISMYITDSFNENRDDLESFSGGSMGKLDRQDFRHGLITDILKIIDKELDNDKD